MNECYYCGNETERIQTLAVPATGDILRRPVCDYDTPRAARSMGEVS